jgi:hypothetical protein
MEIIQQTLESPLVKNITEIYSNEIVPRLTKRNKVIAISAAIFLMVSYKISNVIHPPRKLRHIPHMGYFDFLSTFLKKEHMLQRSQIFALPLVNSEGSNGLYLVISIIYL